MQKRLGTASLECFRYMVHTMGMNTTLVRGSGRSGAGLWPRSRTRPPPAWDAAPWSQAFVDIDVKYRRKKEDHDDVMSVRLYMENPAPCRVTMDVLSDTGKNPVLLDNSLASGAVGKAVCDNLGQ